ncbi:MAG: vWA domain-containing protein [Gemmatimonadota bacterium]
MQSFFDAVFEYFFKYPRVAYDRGEIVWSGSWPTILLALLLAVGVALVVWSYLSSRARAAGATTWILVTTRAIGLAILTVCLLRPTLVLSTAVPQQNVVAVLVDNSRSMGIQDVDGRSRGAVAQELFVAPESALLEQLEENFVIRQFRFAANAERLRDPADLAFDGNRTLLGPSLDLVRSELAGLPLAGVVLVTDGGDQNAAALEDALLGLRAEGIPVHVVGAGRSRLDPDVEIERVELPRAVMRGSTVMANVVVAHTGLGGRTVAVNLEEDGRILASENVRFEGSGGSTTVRVPVTLESPGVRGLTVRVAAQPNEVVADNNQMDVHIRVRDERDKILYYEGQPRFEVGFLRQAVRDDQNLQVVVLQRTGEDRYVRLDVDSGDELAGGFPRTREELFEYRGLILGSVEASSFTPDQIRMIADFVDRRGGGLLFLGGPRALAEGGWAPTALAPVYPLALENLGPERSGTVDFWATVKVTPTRDGTTHPALGLEGSQVEMDPGGAAPQVVVATDSEDARTARWDRLPELTTVNRMGEPRPGATVLLTGVGPDLPDGEQPVLAFQRYGAGMAAVLGVHDTWLWQMHADISLEDQTHEVFWRQILRWLIQEVPDPLTATAVRNRVAPGESVQLIVRVSSEEFLPVNDARVTARVIDPFGAEQELPLYWNLDRDGEYRGSFLPASSGPYEVQVDAVRGESFLTAPPLHIEAGVLDEELRSGAMRENLLRRIATETNGAFYTLDQVSSLPQALTYTERGTVVQEERDLWDLPLFFFLLMGLLFTEWMVRRRRGLA